MTVGLAALSPAVRRRLVDLKIGRDLLVVHQGPFIHHSPFQTRHADKQGDSSSRLMNWPLFWSTTFAPRLGDNAFEDAFLASSECAEPVRCPELLSRLRVL